MCDAGTAAHSQALYNAGKIEALEKRIEALEKIERLKEETLQRSLPSQYDLSRRRHYS